MPPSKLFVIQLILFLVNGLIFNGAAWAQNNSPILNGNTAIGYTLFAPGDSRSTFLIDINGNTVHQWSHNRKGGYAVYLLENGNILRTAQASNSYFNGGGSAGYVQEVDWDGKVVWEFAYSSASNLAHHDIEPMPNGNVLVIAWELKSATEARAAGRRSNASVWPDHIIEVEKSGSQIVWEWHVWDHLVQDYDRTKSNYGVVSEHPELININLGTGSGGPGGGGDWLHVNGVSYNPVLDQIAFTSHNLSEVFVIDHSTTTAEARTHTGGKSGKGGDILYRWGKPSNYNLNGASYFSVVHCPYWVPYDYPGGGNLLIFNNGTNQRASSVIEITPPIQADGNYSYVSGSAFAPAQPAWTYTEGSSFYSSNQGCCQRLPNGNTLITDPDNGHLFEVDQTKQKVWEYQYRSLIARSQRYSPDYKGLARLFGSAVGSQANESKLLAAFELSQNYPNPFNPVTTIQFSVPKTRAVTLTVFNSLGETVVQLVSRQIYPPGQYSVAFDATGLDAGLYFYQLKTENSVQIRKMILLK